MENLHLLADDLRETFGERGHHVDAALKLDPAFRQTRRPQSSLVRSLVLDGVKRASTKYQLGYIPVAGGSCDVQAFMAGVDRRFRVLKARVDPETGEYEIVASSDAIMTITDADPESFYRTERWVLGYTVSESGMVGDIFAARVLGLSDDHVPRLLLSQITPLGSTSMPPWPDGSFDPADEDLDGMEDDVDDGEPGDPLAPTG